MLILDCETSTTALRSLAAAAGVDVLLLRRALLAHDPDQLNEFGEEDPWVAAPRALCAEAGADITKIGFDGAHYFHGSRVLDPHSFLTEGVLPLDNMLDRLWIDLHTLCVDRMTPEQWSALRQELEGDTRTPLHDRDGAWTYRLKFGTPAHYGPYASLVRQHALEPIDGEHAYVKSPEIVEDIARCVDFDLQARFEAKAKSCLVKIRIPRVDQHAVESALLFVWHRLHQRPLDRGSVYGIDCQGRVPAVDVMYVDEFDLGGRAGKAPPLLVSRHRARDCLTDQPLCTASSGQADE
ncbi:hypothetical protein Aph02nite_76660 [Actinoplanes philippinensis]|uniref:Uncharacterized protein n=1 Tax=Actinoplanes philippinensis TaxID=35752 RepID=A0A1I2HI82_9ACTN|nr:hypothetical protein [Actinoplanes philippinensis]GIE81716.1 hypothetical protein Aph02nite_76660 [Actinoplanes philippinensis]SFF28171.1 hypothetical protein SAMN05421541_108107 [Actinoplanes philippinensis]